MPPASPLAQERHVAGGFSWLAIGYAGRTLAYMGLTTVLVRGLEPAAFGRLSVFLALGAGIAALAGSWPFLSVPLLVGAGLDMASAFVPALLIAGGLGVALGVLSITFSNALLLEGGGDVVALLGYATALIVLQGLYAILQTQGRMRAIAAAQTSERLLAALVVAGIAVVGELTVTRAEASLAVAGGLACVGTTMALRSTPLLRRMDGPTLRAGLAGVLGSVGPMALVAVCAYVVAWIDILLLAVYRPESTVGHYALAYQLFSVVLQVASLWIVAALPVHIATAARDRAALGLPVGGTWKMVSLWSAAVAAFALGVTIGLTQVFGRDYQPALAPSLALLASAPLLAAYFAGIPILMAQKRARMVAVVAVAGASLNLLLDLALIPSLGLWGPVIGTVAQNTVASVAILVLLVSRQAALRILAPVVPACASIGALASAPNSWAARGAALLAAVGTASLVPLRRGRRPSG